MRASEVSARLAAGGGRIRHLYLHLPFCERICPYCDFSTAVGAGGDVEAFLGALRAEAGLLDSVGLLGTLDLAGGTLFLGGGTPSWFDEDVLEALLRWVSGVAPGPWLEATAEANPEHATPERLDALRRGGINRLSLGAQSMTAATLRRLGRTHTPEDVTSAVGRARRAGLTVSMDLIFAVPDQTMDSWRYDLDAALALEPDHISLYNLTYEAGTPYQRWLASGRIRALSEDWEAEAYTLAVERARAEGYERYEVSNFARPGHASIHNRAYWSGMSYLGMGPSAHSLLGDVRTAAHFDLASWQTAIGRNEVPWAEVELLDELSVARERVLLGLRTADGVAISEIPASYRDVVERNAEGAPTAEGLAVWEQASPAGAADTRTGGGAGKRLKLTDRGMLLADELAATIAP